MHETKRRKTKEKKKEGNVRKTRGGRHMRPSAALSGTMVGPKAVWPAHIPPATAKARAPDDHFGNQSKP
jgi:hypothetical protein